MRTFSDWKRENAVTLCLRDKSADDRVVALLAGYSDKDIVGMLRKHPTWYRSILER